MYQTLWKGQNLSPIDAQDFAKTLRYRTN